MTDTIYLLQLPYLNENGSPRVVGIRRWDATMLRDAGTHECLGAEGGVIVVTPIVPAETSVTFQLEQKAY